MVDTSSRELKIGTAAAFGAYIMWGLFPIYWKRLSGVESMQILGHRIVWAAAFTLAALLVTRRMGSLAALFKDRRRLAYAAGASILITINWGTYIWAVNSDHVTESSLGYFINPLVSVALGAIFFRERMDKWTSWAVGLAAETLIASPFALAFLIVRHSAGLGSFGGSDTVATIMLFLAGIVTAVPLLCFAAAANRITLTRMGFIQYVSPMIQLALGVFAFGERMTPPMIAAFGAVIGAVMLYVFTRNRAVLAFPSRLSKSVEPRSRP